MSVSMSDSLSKPSAAGETSHEITNHSSATRVAPYTIVLVLAAVLGLTFWLYAKPDLMVMLAEQLWACF